MKTVLFAILATIASAVIGATAALAQEGYRVNAGDRLAIEVLEDPSLNRQVLVTPDGSISFPFAGSLQAQGRTTGQIASQLSSAIAGNFASPPNVFVSVAGLREVRPSGGGIAAPATITIYFLGEVGSPGARAVAPGTTILQALAQAGGLTNFAADRRIQLRRTDPRSFEESVTSIDYRALQRGARLTQNVVLVDGDVILVPQRNLFE